MGKRINKRQVVFCIIHQTMFIQTTSQLPSVQNDVLTGQYAGLRLYSCNCNTVHFRYARFISFRTILFYFFIFIFIIHSTIHLLFIYYYAFIIFFFFFTFFFFLPILFVVRALALHFVPHLVSTKKQQLLASSFFFFFLNG